MDNGNSEKKTNENLNLNRCIKNGNTKFAEAITNSKKFSNEDKFAYYFIILALIQGLAHF
jgi:hypothetical protein